MYGQFVRDYIRTQEPGSLNKTHRFVWSWRWNTALCVEHGNGAAKRGPKRRFTGGRKRVTRDGVSG